MLNLYTETAFQPTPPTPASKLNFLIPRKNGSYDKSKDATSRRREGARQIKDEKSYVKESLASQSSFYFRQFKTYPRTFFWRVCRDGRALQVQCADLARSETDTKEAHLTLEFEFQDSILNAGVTFADFDNHDELSVFVCTRRNEIFTLTLPTNGFRSADAIGTDIRQWCAPIDISSLTIETAHRIQASSPLELFISYTSGKLQRLTRKSNDDLWIPTNYDEKSWGASIRGLVAGRGSQTVTHEGQQLDTRTVQDMVVSSDGTHLFTVCLNHQIRVWHLPSGRLAAAKDLLNQRRDINDRLTLNPVEHGSLQLLKTSSNKSSMLITYSPHDGGQFKVWDVSGGLTDPLVLEDRYPEIKLIPPDPDPSGNTIWSITEFKVDIDGDMNPKQLWTLWRNNNYHQLYTVKLELSTIEDSWNSTWVKCATTSSIQTTPPELITSGSQNITSEWIDFLFFPGRYTEAALETALHIYQDTTLSKSLDQEKSSSLVQRICNYIASSVTLRKYGDADIDYDRFAIDTDQQWRNLWRIVENLSDGRQAPLSLSLDLFSGMVWIAMADQCCAVRESGRLESLYYNKSTEVHQLLEVTSNYWYHRRISANHENLTRMAYLIEAAAKFRQAFPIELMNDLSVAIDHLVTCDAGNISTDRIFEVYDDVNFAEAISNDIFDRLEKNLEPIGGFVDLNTKFVLALFEIFTIKRKSSGTSLRSTTFASPLLSSGILDIFLLQKNVIWDLIALIIFIEGELNQGEDKLEALDTAKIFQHARPMLAVLNRDLWLATHTRLIPLEFPGPNARSRSANPTKDLSVEQLRRVPLLEDILAKDVRPLALVDKPLPCLITDLLEDVQKWVSGKETIGLEAGSVYLLSDLISHGEHDLATDFLRFQPFTPWATYIRGRLHLSKEQFDFASQCFMESAYELACGRAIGNLNELSAGLLSTLDIDCFNDGLPHYNHHILTLFETSKAYSYAMYFARLTLKGLSKEGKEPTTGFKSDTLSRLFNMELKTSHFKNAFETLLQFSDETIQASCLRTLVDTIFRSKDSALGPQGALETLQSLPLSQHPRLTYYIDQHLGTLASKQKNVAVRQSQWTTSDGNIDYLEIVYALRVAQNDFRSAVSILFHRLRLIQRSAQARNDPRSTALRHGFLALINTLSCVTPDEAYILAEVPDGPKKQIETNTVEESSDKKQEFRASAKRRKMIITLDDLRTEYQQLLDRCSRIERGDFEFGMNGASDDEDDENIDDGDQTMEHSRLNGVGKDRDAMEF